MTQVQNQINKAVNYLQSAQKDFNSKSQWGKPNRSKFAADMDVNDDSIILYFDTDKETGFTVALDAEFYANEVISLSIKEIEIDAIEGLEVVSGKGQDELLLECKRIIHDAEKYNLDDITTDFYNEVYA